MIRPTSHTMAMRKALYHFLINIYDSIDYSVEKEYKVVTNCVDTFYYTSLQTTINTVSTFLPNLLPYCKNVEILESLKKVFPIAESGKSYMTIELIEGIEELLEVLGGEI